MVSIETLEQNSSRSNMLLLDQQQQQQQQQTIGPRISFSSEILDDANFISINPKNHEKSHQKEQQQAMLDNNNTKNRATTTTTTRTEFDFLSSNNNVGCHQTMLTADELFFEGKLLPFWQMHHYAERLNKITLKTSKNQENQETEQTEENMVSLMGIKKSNASSNKQSNKNPLEEDQELPRMSSGSSNGGCGGVSWFVDEDPSPRPPKCTVLWKELLRLKKQRAASTLSPSSSSSSTSSSSSSLGDAAAAEENERKQRCNSSSSSNSNVKRVKKGLERTRSASIRIRPMVNVPICTHQLRSCSTKTSSALPPLFPIGLNKKGRSFDR